MEKFERMSAKRVSQQPKEKNEAGGREDSPPS